MGCRWTTLSKLLISLWLKLLHSVLNLQPLPFWRRRLFLPLPKSVAFGAIGFLATSSMPFDVINFSWSVLTRPSLARQRGKYFVPVYGLCKVHKELYSLRGQHFYNVNQSFLPYFLVLQGMCTLKSIIQLFIAPGKPESIGIPTLLHIRRLTVWCERAQFGPSLNTVQLHKLRDSFPYTRDLSWERWIQNF